MIGHRKLIAALVLGIAYLACSTAIIWKAMDYPRPPDFTALGIMLGGLATGVASVMAAFVYGNRAEYGDHDAR